MKYLAILSLTMTLTSSVLADQSQVASGSVNLDMQNEICQLAYPNWLDDFTRIKKEKEKELSELSIKKEKALKIKNIYDNMINYRENQIQNVFDSLLSPEVKKKLKAINDTDSVIQGSPYDKEEIKKELFNSIGLKDKLAEMKDFGYVGNTYFNENRKEIFINVTTFDNPDKSKSGEDFTIVVNVDDPEKPFVKIAWYKTVFESFKIEDYTSDSSQGSKSELVKALDDMDYFNDDNHYYLWGRDRSRTYIGHEEKGFWNELLNKKDVMPKDKEILLEAVNGSRACSVVFAKSDLIKEPENEVQEGLANGEVQLNRGANESDVKGDDVAGQVHDGAATITSIDAQ